jgi:hypothetical protein
MSEIKYLIIQRIVQSLIEQCQDPYPEEDPTRMDLVQAFRFQGDPNDYPVYAWVSDGDPKDPYAMDGRIDSVDAEHLGLRVPAGEIGGGHLWWRSGRVVIGCYYLTDDFSQDVAADYAHTFLGRVELAVERTLVGDLTDDYGEQAYKIFLVSSSFFEGGGPDNQYLWRGEIYWQVLTSRPI